MPKTWKQGLIIKIPKKGDLTECGNWRGITLTFVPSKVFGRLLIDKIRDGVNSKLRDEQAGFRTGRGTVEQIFILRNIIEQVVKWQSTLYITFVDFEKAFDSVHRESMEKLWRAMELRKLKQIWSSNIYTLRSKLRLFNTLVKPVLLYGSETWKINEGDNRKIHFFQVLETNLTNSMAIRCIKSRYSRKNKNEDNQH